MEGEVPYVRGQDNAFNVTILIAVVVVLITLIVYNGREIKPYPGLKLHGRVSGDFFYTKTKEQYAKYGSDFLKKGYDEAKGKIFQILGGSGPLIILPPSFIDEIRNDKRMTLSGFLEHVLFSNLKIIRELLLTSRKEFFPDYPGMEPWQEWTELPILQTLVPIVAQLTTKIFTGEPLCNNPEWIDISIKFTIEGSMASRALRSWPAILRPLVYRFIPEMRQIQHTYSRADKLLQEEVKSRRLAAEAATAEGKPAPHHKDALSWFSDAAAGRKYSMTQGQLLLSFAAIHTTSTTLYAFLFDLLSTPTLLPELRDEMAAALRADGGLTKASLHKLHLLDSCLKESQRLSPLGSTSLHRHVDAPVTLSDGTRLPRGAVTAVPSFHMHRGLAFDGRSTSGSGTGGTRVRGGLWPRAC
ncbi:putative cytochrome p450 protein [Neofusicoccum parvum UCRNP2]|uniref:Putative cytochrome p450 protein n=1 Tax=Botryosphaeria parva (strain UCR-NP2) TaxID=1287680 RepID=R1EPM7_BOTPV|nr:putative cytochrome p450 protein [Neofusicoccum parvum UCRNP2]